MFYPSLPRNCGPWCLVLQLSNIHLLRKVRVKARQATPVAEQHPFLRFTIATEDALKRKLLQLQGSIRKLLMRILNFVYTAIWKALMLWSPFSPALLPGTCTATDDTRPSEESQTRCASYIPTTIIKIWAVNSKRSSTDREMCKYYNK